MEMALRVEGIRVSYPVGLNSERIVLDDLSLEIREGEVVGLLGPNGAGKTTLIKAIIGLIGFNKGSIRLFEQPSLSAAVKRRIGYMPEVANYYRYLTPEEILTFLGRLSSMDPRTLAVRIDEVLEIVDLRENKRSLVRSFSKGMQGRLNIAQALLHDPELFILDEPFSGLDPLGRIQVRSIIKKLKDGKKTILLSSHELSEAELICDHVAVLKKGRIVKQGAVADLFREAGEDNLENYFFKIISDPCSGSSAQASRSGRPGDGSHA